MFAKLAKAGLKLKPSKWKFFKSKIAYLGHIFSAKGIYTDSKTVTDVRSFLGFTNHYRRFIKGYANVVRPLNTLISADNANHKKALIELTDECQTAFEKLTEKQMFRLMP